MKVKSIYTAQEIYNEFFNEHSDICPWSTFRLISIGGRMGRQRK